MADSNKTIEYGDQELCGEAHQTRNKNEHPWSAHMALQDKSSSCQTNKWYHSLINYSSPMLGCSSVKSNKGSNLLHLLSRWASLYVGYSSQSRNIEDEHYQKSLNEFCTRFQFFRRKSQIVREQIIKTLKCVNIIHLVRKKLNKENIHINQSS